MYCLRHLEVLDVANLRESQKSPRRFEATFWDTPVDVLDVLTLIGLFDQWHANVEIESCSGDYMTYSEIFPWKYIPIFSADFQKCSYGIRHRMGADDVSSGAHHLWRVMGFPNQAAESKNMYTVTGKGCHLATAYGSNTTGWRVLVGGCAHQRFSVCRLMIVIWSLEYFGTQLIVTQVNLKSIMDLVHHNEITNLENWNICLLVPAIWRKTWLYDLWYFLLQVPTKWASYWNIWP